jgi:hypothetical protein
MIQNIEDKVGPGRRIVNDLIASLQDEPTPRLSDLTRQLEALIGTAEANLRDLIERRLYAYFGVRAWTGCVPGAIQQAVQQRVELQIKRNPVEQDQYDSLGARLA